MEQNPIRSISAQELPLLLEKASLFGGVIHQPTPNQTFNATIKKMSIIDPGTMDLEMAYEVSFQKNRPVSIKLNYRNVSFLLEPGEFSVEGKVIKIKFPKVAKALVVRDHERYALPLNSDIQCHFHRVEKRNEKADAKGVLIDISEMGIGLKVSEAWEGLLVKNDHLWIKTLHDHEFKTPLFAKVVYVQKRVYKDGITELKIGLALEKPIPREILTSIKELCQLILSA